MTSDKANELATAIAVGDIVLVRMDDGTERQYVVKTSPWQLGHGAWVVGLHGVTGGYSLDRVVRVLSCAEPAEPTATTQPAEPVSDFTDLQVGDVVVGKFVGEKTVCCNPFEAAGGTWLVKLDGSPYFLSSVTRVVRRAGEPAVEPEPVKANDPLAEQVSGSHYKDMPIQPVEFIHKNGIGFIEGCAIKYLCRWRVKNGVDDLRKAKHFIELLIDFAAWESERAIEREGAK